MKRLFTCVVACLPAAAFAQAGQFTIEGSLVNYNAPAKMYLQYSLNDKYITDSVTLVNGKFKFTGETGADDPTSAFMAFNPKGNGINNNDSKVVFLEKGVVTVTGADNLKNAIAGGTLANVDNEKLNSGLTAVNSAWDKCLDRANAATGQQRQSVEFQDETNKELNDIQQQKNIVDKKFIAENPDSYISLYTLNNYAYSGDYKGTAALYDGLSDRLKQSTMGR
jgi:hypothetical protein